MNNKELITLLFDEVTETIKQVKRNQADFNTDFEKNAYRERSVKEAY